MTDKRWPILDLDDGATESDVRRAYAKRLREQGPDADVASFQALRSEFEAALAAARSGSTVRVAVQTSRLPPPLERTVDAVAARRPGERFAGRWNWGAFLLTPFWLMAHGLRNQGVGFLAFAAIALLVPHGSIAVAIAAAMYGRRGNLLAARHRRFSNETQFVAVQNEWRNVGIAVVTGCGVCYALAVAWIVGTFK